MYTRNAVQGIFSQDGHDESSLGSLVEASRNELLPAHNAEHRRLLNLFVDCVFNWGTVIGSSVRSQLLVQQLEKPAIHKQDCMLRSKRLVLSAMGRRLRSDEVQAQDLDREVACVHWIKVLVTGQQDCMVVELT
jgi:hypothetical protein